MTIPVCTISGPNCHFPAVGGAAFIWAHTFTPADIAPCSACGEYVCDACSGCYWYNGMPVRLCARCAQALNALPFTAANSCELCHTMGTPGGDLMPYGGKVLCLSCREKLEAVRELCGETPEYMVSFVIRG